MLDPTTALAAVRDRLVGRPGTSWVGVDGLGASGKSTFAARLVRALPGAALIGVDDFAHPGADPWDQAAFTAQVLTPLLAGRPARWTGWDPVRDVWLPPRTVSPAHPVVVEGVSATDLAVAVPWDVRIWVHAPAAVRHRRARERDGEDVWQHRWLADWIPSEEAYLRAQRPDLRADLVVDASGASASPSTRPGSGQRPDS